MSRNSKFLGCITGSALFATSVAAEKVGDIDVDWLGNDIIVEAFAESEVSGVICHIAYFERGVLDRFKKGNWFERCHLVSANGANCPW